MYLYYFIYTCIMIFITRRQHISIKQVDVVCIICCIIMWFKWIDSLIEEGIFRVCFPVLSDFRFQSCAYVNTFSCCPLGLKHWMLDCRKSSIYIVSPSVKQAPPRPDVAAAALVLSFPSQISTEAWCSRALLHPLQGGFFTSTSTINPFCCEIEFPPVCV